MLRVNTVGSGWAGAPYFSTLYFGGETAGEASAAAAATRVFWDTIKGFITSGGTFLVQSDVEHVDPATGLITAVFPITSTVVSTTGNAPLPKATQGLLRWRTGVYAAGKEIRGRTFIPALANDAQVGGVPSGPFVASVQGAAAALLSTMPSTNEVGVYSRKNGSFAPASSTSVWAEFAVLRSRRD